MTVRIVLILVGLSAFGPLAIDLYLPSFDFIAKDFLVGSDKIQLTLSSYLIGLALGQILYGPLADKLGRRTPLFFGLCLFSVMSILCSFASSLNQLIALRFLQALGGCAGMVISRAIVRDLCDPTTAAKVFSQLMLVTGIAPIVAPLIGSFLIKYFAWQSSFYFCFIFSVLCISSVFIWLPETIPANSPRPPLNTVVKQYSHFLKQLPFLGYSIISGLMLAGLFIYVGSSHFLFVEIFGLSKLQFAGVFGLNSVSIMFCAQLNNILLVKHDSVYWVKRIPWISLMAGLLLIVAAYLKAPLWVFIVLIMMFLGTVGMLLPNLTACAMALAGRQAGSASALMGSLQFSIAASMSGLTAWLNNGTSLVLAIMLTVCSLLALIIVFTALRNQQSICMWQ